VSGGSREYVKQIAAALSPNIHLNTGVISVRRAQGGIMLSVEGHGELYFDKVVLAAHADQSLNVLSDAKSDEREILSAFQFRSNLAVLHSDPRLMPQRRAAWASWNYIGVTDQKNALCLTYWMNRLQGIDPVCPLYETLNPVIMPHAQLLHGSFTYRHPIVDTAAIAAQSRLREIQGRDHVFFAGAWTGYGFHEDGLKSAVAIAKTLGATIPWKSNVVSYDADTSQLLGAL
jgi:hypothetical protein